MAELHEVAQPIINIPYKEPECYYEIKPGEPAKLVAGRRPAMYYYRPPERQTGKAPSDDPGTAFKLELVNGISTTTLSILDNDLMLSVYYGHGYNTCSTGTTEGFLGRDAGDFGPLGAPSVG